jgi:Holliday junction resolvase RusA-like endonuclease
MVRSKKGIISENSLITLLFGPASIKTCVPFGVSIKIRVATDKWIIPDYTNVCQALGDILQHYKIISDDKWIHWTDGEFNNNVPQEHWLIGVDKENPRIEIEMRRFRHPVENYRLEKEQAEEKKRKKK